MDLNGFYGLFHRHFRGIQLGHGRRLIIISTGVLVDGRTVNQHARSFHFCSHIGQFESDGLVLVDFFSEGFALFWIFGRQFESTCCNTQCLSGYSNTSTRKHFHRKLESKTVLTNSIFFWDLNIIEQQSMSVTPSDSHFILFCSYDKSFHSSLNYKSIDAFVTQLNVGLSYHQVSRSRRTIGNPIFCSV